MGDAQAIDLPSKVTATELKRLEAEYTPPRTPAHRCWRARRARRPFAGRTSQRARASSPPPSAARPRTASCNTSACRRAHAGGHPRAGRRFTARGELTGREGAGRGHGLAPALATRLGAQLAAAEAAGTLRREFRFSLLCPVETFFPGTGDEQGAAAGRGGCVVRNKGWPRHRGL